MGAQWMSARTRLALAVASICAAVLAAIAAVAGALWADFDAAERAASAALLEARLVSVLALLTLVAAVTAIAFAPFVRRLFGGPARLAEETRLLLDANRAWRLRPVGPTELDALARSINQLADQRDALQTDVERRIRESQAALEEERNRLAALVAELAQGIVACNLDGGILLYNNRARLQFTALAQGGATPLGLARSIFGLIERPLIEHALDSIRRRLEGGRQRAVAHFVTAGRDGRLIRVQMAPVLGAGRDGTWLSGYVLLLENITRSFEAEARRDFALHTLTEGSRAALGNIRAAVETLAGYPDMEAGQRERFVGVIAQEVSAMSERLDAIAREHADALKARWVLEEMRGADLVAAARAAIEARAGVTVASREVAPALWVRADSFALIQALAWLVTRLRAEFGVAHVVLRMVQSERLARLDLLWPAVAAAPEALVGWEHETMRLAGGYSPLNLHELAERHGGEAWFQRDDEANAACCRLLLPLAEPDPEPATADIAARPEYYDFALFERAAPVHGLDERPLAGLAYTVFDTETTGLAPAQGDEIIQIGAVRIVNLRLLRNDTFEQLVDPRRPIDRASFRMHGISEDMLRGQPAIDEVLPAFHAFCEDTVLVGHNVAFDMRFLQLKEAATGVRFEQPLLDTLLLSEVIHPAHDSHRLEAIAERLGVPIEARHDALADALVTAEVFVRMIGLLADAGIRTLGQARAAAARTRYAKVQY